jgi:two-component system sensor kinase FixL
MQSELFQVSRLDSMGQLTIAIAHELNQPLAAMCNYVGAAKQGLRSKKSATAKIDATYELIDKASAQALRASAIVKRLRGFVEKREVSRLPADLGQIVEESLALAFVSPAFAGVKVVMKFDNALPPVFVDHVQIQQLLFNLIRNSLEAMLSSQKRELTLETRRGPAGFAEVTVQDSGPGLDPKVQKDLFQPFVTAKDCGMGVGLSICRTIAEANGGRIWLAHSDTDGAIFGVGLPLSPANSQ